MVRLVERAKEEGDTLGGAVTVIARGVPPGLGSHVQWDEKLDGRLAQAILSIHAVKAVEIGAGVAASQGFGSAAHDAIERAADGRWHRPTNRAGGLEGGVTNGEDVVITAYKKPIATLRKGLPSVDLDTLEARTSQYERSDVTALPAAGVIAEAMVALVLADALLEKLGGDSMAELKAHWQATRGAAAGMAGLILDLSDFGLAARGPWHLFACTDASEAVAPPAASRHATARDPPGSPSFPDFGAADGRRRIRACRPSPAGGATRGLPELYRLLREPIPFARSFPHSCTRSGAAPSSSPDFQIFLDRPPPAGPLPLLRLWGRRLLLYRDRSLTSQRLRPRGGKLYAPLPPSGWTRLA